MNRPGLTVVYIEKKKGKRTYKRVTLPIMTLIQEKLRSRSRAGENASPATFYLPHKTR